jgi:hypothetical protein
VKITNYNFLRILDIPQKFSISHKIVSKLIDKSANKKHKVEYDEDELSSDEKHLLDTINHFFSKEESFFISKIEYEKKEDRFIKLTNYTEEKLETLYHKSNLYFNDIHSKQMEEIIESEDLNAIIDILNVNSKIINSSIENCYNRIEILLVTWKDLTSELLTKINNFEHRGLKIISNNLRLRLLPQLEVMKGQLKLVMNDDSSSRAKIEEQLRNMVMSAEEDLLQALSEDQIKLFDQLSPSPSTKELVSILRDKNNLSDLVELILSDFVKVNFVKKELDVI